MIIVGCIIMGMGLPTVAAYIIGAILFVPALTKLGIDALAAHFFVMYYCVLSMITPPVALASYTAAGIARADAMKTGWIAFKLSLVLFLIPFAFAFDPALLWSGPPALDRACLSCRSDGGDVCLGRVSRGVSCRARGLGRCVCRSPWSRSPSSSCRPAIRWWWSRAAPVWLYCARWRTARSAPTAAGPASRA